MLYLSVERLQTFHGVTVKISCINFNDLPGKYLFIHDKTLARQRLRLGPVDQLCVRAVAHVCVLVAQSVYIAGKNKKQAPHAMILVTTEVSTHRDLCATCARLLRLTSIINRYW